MIWLGLAVAFLLFALAYDAYLKVGIRAMKYEIEKLRAEVHQKVVPQLRSEITEVMPRLLEIEMAVDRASKKADTAEFMAHSAKMSVARPVRVVLTIEEPPKKEPIKKTPMPKRKSESLLRRAGITKSGRA